MKKRGEWELHGGSRDNKVFLQFAFRSEIIDGFVNQSIGSGRQVRGDFSFSFSSCVTAPEACVAPSSH